MQSSLIKRTKGRQKIEIKKIESEDVRHVTFSKRRIGLFKKASDLSTLCGASIAMVVYSPTGKPYSFGSPAVEPVINRFLTGNMEDVVGMTEALGELPPLLMELNEKFMELSKRIDDARAKKIMMEEALKEFESEKYVVAMNSNMKELELDELEGLGEKLMELKMRVDAKVGEVLTVPVDVNPLNMVGTSNQQFAVFPFAAVGANPFEGNMGFGNFGHGWYY